MFFSKRLIASLILSVKAFFLRHSYIACVLLLLHAAKVNAVCYDYSSLYSIPNISFNQKFISFTPEANPEFSFPYHSAEFPHTYVMCATLSNGQKLWFHSINNAQSTDTLQLTGVKSDYLWYLYVTSMTPAQPHYNPSLITPVQQQAPCNEHFPATTAGGLNQGSLASPITPLSTAVEILKARVDELTIKLESQPISSPQKQEINDVKNDVNYKALETEISQKESLIGQLEEKIKRLENSLSEQKKNYNISQTNLDAEKKNNKAAEELLKKIKDEAKKIQQKSKELLSIAEEEKEQKITENSKLKEELKNLNQLLIENKKKLQTLKEELATTKKTLEREQIKTENLTNQPALNKKRLDKYQYKMASQHQQEEEEDKENKTISNLLSQQKEDEKKALQEKLENSERKLSTYKSETEEQLKKLKHEVETSQQKSKSLSEDQKKTEKEKHKLKKKHQENEANTGLLLKQVETEKKALDEQLKQLERKLLSQKTESEEQLAKEQKKYSNHMENLKKTTKEMKKKLKEKDENHLLSEAIVTNQLETIEHLNKTIEEKDNEIYDLKNVEKKRAALKKICDGLVEKNKELSQDNSNLLEVWGQATSDLKTVSKENIALTSRGDKKTLYTDTNENAIKANHDQKENLSTGEIQKLDHLFSVLNLAYRTPPSSAIGLLYSIGRSVCSPSVEASFIEALIPIIQEGPLADFIKSKNIDLNNIQESVIKKLCGIPRRDMPRPIAQLLLIFSWIYKETIIVIQPLDFFGKNREGEVYRAVKIDHKDDLEYITEPELPSYIMDSHENPIILGLYPEGTSYNSAVKFFHIYKRDVDQLTDTKTDLIEELDKLDWRSASSEQSCSTTTKKSLDESDL